jgi:hypothetical protein
MEGGGCGLIEILSRNFPGGTEKNKKKISFKVTDVLV